MNKLESLQDVITFVQVIESGSFKGAADALGVSTSSVSKHVTRLEASLGVQLIHRTTRRLMLTEPGEAYFNQVRSIPGQLVVAQEKTHPLCDAMQGKMRLVAPFGFDNSMRNHIVPEFVRDFPDIELTVDMVRNPAEHMHEYFDVLISGKPPQAKFPDSSLVSRWFLDLVAGVYATPDYLEKYGTPRVPQDLLSHRCTSYLVGDQWMFAKGDSETYILEIPCCFHSNSSALQRSVTESGSCICYGFDFMFVEALATGQVVKVLEEHLPKTIMEMYLFYPKSEFQPVKTRELVRRIVEIYSCYQGDGR